MATQDESATPSASLTGPTSPAASPPPDSKSTTWVSLDVGLRHHLARMSGAEVKVYVALRTRYNTRTGQLNPSLETIAADTGLTRTSVKAAVKNLRVKKLVTTSRTGTSNRWTLSAIYANGRIVGSADGPESGPSTTLTRPSDGPESGPSDSPETGPSDGPVSRPQTIAIELRAIELQPLKTPAALRCAGEGAGAPGAGRSAPAPSPSAALVLGGAEEVPAPQAHTQPASQDKATTPTASPIPKPTPSAAHTSIGAARVETYPASEEWELLDDDTAATEIDDVRVVFLYVGQGSSAIVFMRDSDVYRVLVVDINLGRKLGGIDVPRLVTDLLDGEDLEAFVNTHPHDDHLCGTKELSEAVTIKAVWHSNHKPSKKYGSKHGELTALIKKVTDAYGDDAQVIIDGSNSSVTYGEAEYHFLAPAEHVTDDVNEEDAEKRRARIHEQCGVVKFGKDKTWIMIVGDADRCAFEKHITKYHKDRLASFALAASHHGSRTFFRENEEDDAYLDALNAIDPEYVVISAPTQDESPHGHPHDDAVELYEDHVGEDTRYFRKKVKSDTSL